MKKKQKRKRIQQARAKNKERKKMRKNIVSDFDSFNLTKEEKLALTQTLGSSRIEHNDYKNNHYVPRWYQKRFLFPNQEKKEFYYLDLNPSNFTDGKGRVHQGRSIKKQGSKYCFCENDLYTLNFKSIESKEIEKYFFGDIDNRGRQALNYFTNFEHPSVNGDAFRSMLTYMSTQKLRTPKGLDWLSAKSGGTKNKEVILGQMLRFKDLFCAIWSECIWLIADASKSDTKFIISDHPITAYNRVCGPRSQWCRGSNDPDIWLNGTHTIFPLSINKILILTNLSWVRNPYQSEKKFRPNPNPLRDAMFKFTDIQTLRYLTEQEVLEINFIIKSRAYKYISSAQEEWLYPEKFVSKSNWNKFGDGYLLMPDPRAVSLGGEVFIGHWDGTTSAYDAYGRRPWQANYGKESKKSDEFKTLYKFKGEFAKLYGPYRRGRSFNAMQLDKECDSENFHKYHLSLYENPR